MLSTTQRQPSFHLRFISQGEDCFLNDLVKKKKNAF